MFAGFGRLCLQAATRSAHPGISPAAKGGHRSESEEATPY